MSNLKLADVEIHHDINNGISKIIVNGKDLSMVTRSATINIEPGDVPTLQLDIYTDNVKFKGKINANPDIDEINVED